MSHKRSDISIYVTVYVVLLVLLALTVEAARHDLGHWNFAVTMAIAGAKAVCIGLFFMHLRTSTPLVKLVVTASLLWIAILFSLSLADYWTRDWDSLVGGSRDVSRSDAAQ